jgi:hypothetical protein
MSISLSRALNATTAIALAAAIGFIVKGKSESPAPAITAAVSDTAQHSRLASLERELHALSSLPNSGKYASTDVEQRLDALKREMTMLSKPTSSKTEPAAQTPVDPIEQEQQERELLQQEVALMENALRSEPADASGSMNTAAEISAVMQTAAFEKSSVNGVQCNTSMCRIDASYPNPHAAMQFSQALNEIETFQNSEGFVQQLPRADGGIDVVMYVSRGNHQLPASPQG